MAEFNNSVEAMIENIVTVVFRIHFYYVNNEDLENDLKQEGYLKAYSLLKEGNYDPTKNLRTFIYTGVRNAMTNYMYHTKKESHEDLDTVSSPAWQSYKDITMDSYWDGKLFYNDTITMDSVDDNIVFSVCEKYKMFGNYIYVVLNEFNKMGIYNNHFNIAPDFKINTFIKDSIIGEILWNISKNL